MLRVRVQPRAGRDRIAGIHDGRLRVRIGAPPIDGRANAQLRRLIAKLFGVAPGRVVVLSGETCRDKQLLVKDPQSVPEVLRQEI